MNCEVCGTPRQRHTRKSMVWLTCKVCKRNRTLAAIEARKVAKHEARRPEEPDRKSFASYRAYMREYMRWYRWNQPGLQSAQTQDWRQRNPEKYIAHQLTKRAVALGFLKRQPCERCGSTTKIHTHHDDYTKPLDVMWLCPVHHKERHAELDRAGRIAA